MDNNNPPSQVQGFAPLTLLFPQRTNTAATCTMFLSCTGIMATLAAQATIGNQDILAKELGKGLVHLSGIIRVPETVRAL